MYVPYHQLRVVHEEMLEEMMRRGRMNPKRPRKRSPGPRRRPIEHTLATLLVKFGRSLERFGQAHLVEDTPCGAC
jgi:hypothetical protein